MRKMLVVLSLGLFASLSFSQNLVDVAKKSREENQKAKKGRVITNRDLPSASRPSQTPEAQAGAPEGGTPEGGAAEGEMGPSKQQLLEKEYKEKIYQKVKYFEDVRRQQDVAMLEYNRISNAYNKESNGVYRDNVIRAERQKAFDHQEEAKKAVAQAKTDLDNLKEEARKKGVPAGVIREAEDMARKGIELPDQEPAPKGKAGAQQPAPQSKERPREKAPAKSAKPSGDSRLAPPKLQPSTM